METNRELNLSGDLEAKLVVNEPPKLSLWHRTKLRCHSAHLQWKLDHGLACRGRTHPRWAPRPNGLLAKLYARIFL